MIQCPGFSVDPHNVICSQFVFHPLDKRSHCTVVNVFRPHSFIEGNHKININICNSFAFFVGLLEALRCWGQHLRCSNRCDYSLTKKKKTVNAYWYVSLRSHASRRMDVYFSLADAGLLHCKTCFNLFHFSVGSIRVHLETCKISRRKLNDGDKKCHYSVEELTCMRLHARFEQYFFSRLFLVLHQVK